MFAEYTDLVTKFITDNYLSKENTYIPLKVICEEIIKFAGIEEGKNFSGNIQSLSSVLKKSGFRTYSHASGKWLVDYCHPDNKLPLSRIHIRNLNKNSKNNQNVKIFTEKKIIEEKIQIGDNKEKFVIEDNKEKFVIKDVKEKIDAENIKEKSVIEDAEKRIDIEDIKQHKQVDTLIIDDNKLNSIQSENTQLKSENTQLKSENTQLKSENTQLKSEISSLQKQNFDLIQHLNLAKSKSETSNSAFGAAYTSRANLTQYDLDRIAKGGW